MRDDGVLLSGRRLTARPDWLIGTVENPFAPPIEYRARRLAKKVAAGAEFVQTQYVFDLKMFGRWMADVRDLGITDRCAVIAGVGPIRSLRMLDFLCDGVPGIHLPDAVARRLRGVPPTRVADEGIRLCVETIQRLTEIPGVAGVHVMAFGFERGVPDILQQAGVGPMAQTGVPARSAPTTVQPSTGALDENSRHAC